MFRNNAIVGAVEFGSSGICVLLGETLPDGTLSVIGRGEAPAAGIVKDNEALLAAVNEAINAAIADGSMDKFVAEANTGKGLKVQPWMKPLFTYIVPVAIFMLYVTGLASFPWN